jgi:hypothetical protein
LKKENELVVVDVSKQQQQADTKEAAHAQGGITACMSKMCSISLERADSHVYRRLRPFPLGTRAQSPNTKHDKKKERKRDPQYVPLYAYADVCSAGRLQHNTLNPAS